MKKVFTLIVALFIGVVVANATVYSFGGITSSMITVNAAGSLNTATITDSALCVYDYGVTVPGTMMTLDVATQLPNIEVQYTNGSSKTAFLKFYPNVFYTAGKGVSIVISNVNVNDSIIIHTTAKGTTADTWTVSGANTSSTLTVNNSSWVDLRFKATAATVTLKETTGGFKISSLNWFSNIGTGITTSQTNTLSIRSVPGAILISQPADVEILNVTGKEVMTATQSTSVSTVSLPKGLYIVRAQASNSNVVQKVIVQ